MGQKKGCLIIVFSSIIFGFKIQFKLDYYP
nr:MAG TPA: hypothetical protein [Caudoviricetes sp.]